MQQSCVFNKNMMLSAFPTQDAVSQDVLYRKLKQNLLREQISVENQMDFGDYLEMARMNGTNIDVWTYDELVDVVDKFRESRNLKSGFTSEILKESEEKDGWFSTVAFYYIETKEMGTDGAIKTKWEVKRTQQQF